MITPSLKTMLKNIKKKKKKKKSVYSADGKHFKFDRIKNFFISVNKPKNTKNKAL